MTRRLLFALPAVLAFTVLIASGSYVLIYLYRWEWNRALIMGLIFVAAEIAIAAGYLARRIRVLEAALQVGTTPYPAPARLVSDALPPREAPFAWLSETERAGVFVPVLLAAGAVVSALTYLLERLAGAVAGATVDRRTANLLGTVGGAGDGGAGPTAALGAHSGLDRPRRGRARSLAWVALIVAAAAVIGGIGRLADATQTRPDPVSSGGTTTLELRIDQRQADRSPVLAGEALWIACRSLTPGGIELQRVEAFSANQVLLEVRPALGAHAERRVVGCLEDATLDLITAQVVSVSHSADR